MIEFNDALVSEYLPHVYGFVRKYIGNAELAEDVTQEAFVKAWKNFKKFDQTKSFRSWIFTIAKNTAIDEIKKKRDLSLDENVQIADTSISFADRLMQKQSAHELSVALAQIPSNYSTVIAMHVTDGRTFREIASSFRQPLNTIKSQYRRGLAGLKKLL